MSSSLPWLYKTPFKASHSGLNGMAVIENQESAPVPNASINNLVQVMSGFSLPAFLGFTEIQDVLHSITFYPINLNKGSRFQSGLLTVNNAPVSSGDASVVAKRLDIEKYSCGLFMGQQYIDDNNSYTDYEPYCKTSIWLPYCGLVEIPRPKIVGKYLVVLLYIDFNTGNAQYVIGSSIYDISSYFTEDPFLYGKTVDLREIIATEEFVLGYKFPIGTTGFNDYLRNAVVGVAKTSIGIYGASVFTPASLIPMETTEVIKSRSPTTNRLITEYKATSIRGPADTSSVKNYKKGRVAQTVASSISSLACNQMQGSVSNTNNPMMMYNTTQSVKVITTRSVLSEYTEEFDKTYGRPLGKSVVLNTIHGFADLSSIRLDGVGVGKTILEEEVDMLESIMLSGVILP